MCLTLQLIDTNSLLVALDIPVCSPFWHHKCYSCGNVCHPLKQRHSLHSYFFSVKVYDFVLLTFGDNLFNSNHFCIPYIHGWTNTWSTFTEAVICTIIWWLIIKVSQNTLETWNLRRHLLITNIHSYNEVKDCITKATISSLVFTIKETKLVLVSLSTKISQFIWLAFYIPECTCPRYCSTCLY